jgi:hypothetical protein
MKTPFAGRKKFAVRKKKEGQTRCPSCLSERYNATVTVLISV